MIEYKIMSNLHQNRSKALGVMPESSTQAAVSAPDAVVEEK
jgi:hypothetical protein